MNKLFDKKIVAITGAAGGIGQELCRHFGREGATIFAIDKKDTVNTFAIELAAEGITVHPLTCDINNDINGNLNGAYNCVHTVLPGMKKKGKAAIVTVGSVNGLSALGDPAYSAAKAALISMTKAIAMETGRYGIRANIVLPGTVRTPIWNARAAKNPEVLKTLTRWYPLARIAEPSDIANAVAFLASDAASAITGVELLVDCGLTAGNIVMSRELTLENF